MSKVDEFLLPDADFDAIEQRNNARVDEQEVVEDESDCDGCKI